MNNIIGNTPYRNIQNKQYIDSSAEYISKLAERLQNENIPFSGRISEYKSTITVSGEDNLKKARKILNDIISENPRRYIGNTQYKYIRDKHIIPVEAEIIDKIADRLNAEHIMYSGIVEGEKGRLTVSGAEIEALVKGYIEQEKSSTAAVTYEISLTSDAFEDIYYICDENGNAYYDKDGAIPTFNHVDEAEKYSKANNIPLTNDEELLNHWREIEHIDKIRHDNSKLVSMFKANGENYPDHFTYNASGNSFEWLYYNPDGNFGEGEFIRKTIYEQDIVAAYNARISAADENSGRNEFIYSLFSSCEEIVISSDTEEFTTVANEYINKSETTLELYGIAENSSNIAAVDRLISALEEKCPAVRSAEESRNNAVINEQSDNIDIDGHIGTWYVIDSAIIDGKTLYLLESEIYGDEAACIIVDESKNIIMSDVWNGFDDYQAYLSDHQARISNKNSPAEINSPVGNAAPEKELSLSEQLLKIAKKELEEYENSLDTAEKAKAAAYELTVKRDILSYIEYDLSNDIADLDVQTAVENLIKSGAPLSVYYDEWLKNEYDSRMEAVRMTAADVHKIEIQHNSEIERDSEKYEVVSESTYSEKNKTLIVNIYGGPGAGKSTAALQLVAELKKRGYHAEYVSEVAKEYVYAKKFDILDGSLEHQKQIMSEQQGRVDLMIGNVDVAITDAPLLLNTIYLNPNEKTSEYSAYVLDEYNKYNNYNIYIDRDLSIEFEKEGRIHNLSESIEKDGEIKAMLISNGIAFDKCDRNNISGIAEKIVDNIEGKNSSKNLQLTQIPEEMMNIIFDDMPSFVKSAVAWDELMEYDGISVRFDNGEDPVEVIKPYLANQGTFSWNTKELKDGYFTWSVKDKGATADISVSVNDNITLRKMYNSHIEVSWFDIADAFKKRIEQEKNYNKLYDKTISVASIGDDKYRFIDKDENVDVIKNRSELEAHFKELFNKEELNGIIKQLIDSAPFEEYTAPENQLPDGMAVIDDIDNAILMWERGVEVYHNNEPIPAHKADDKVYEIFAEQDGIYTASKSDVEMFSDANAIASAIWDMNEIFNSVPNEQGQPYYLSLSNSYDEWTDYETGLNEYENTLNALYGGNYSSVITYIENVRDSDEVSKELQEQADSLLDEVKNFKKLFGIPEKDIKEKNIEAVQNIKVGDEITFNEKTYVITSITDDFMMSMKPKDVSGEQLALSDKSYIGNWKQQLVEEAGENPITIFKSDVSIALITVHQYDSQYTKAIENFSLSDAIKQMDPVDYKSFYGMGEQISISRAAEIEQGNNKWAYSIDFDLDYNTARISTPTDDYINIGIDEALSIVNNHSEDELISVLKKLAEKEEEQADFPDYSLANEEQKKLTYEIYQIPSGERYRDIRFTRYEQLEFMGQLPDHLNYEKVYSGNLDDIEYNDKLEGIFVKFNNNRPEDFKGRSLSVSDVVVIEDENGKSAHFVDDVGFKDITDIFFEHERKEQSVEQLNINDYESIRLVSRSEWDDHTLGDDENPAFEEISVSYTPDEDGSYTKYAYNTTNSGLVDVWDEENSVSGDELLEDIANHLKKVGQDKSNRSYHIVLTDYDGNSRKLDSNNFSFILKDKQRKESEMAASDLEIEKSIEEGIIGSMGYPIDEMDKAFEAENSKTDYGNEAEPARKKSGNDIEVGDRFLYNDREYTVTSDKGIYPDDVGVSYEEKVGNTSYLTTQNVDRYKLADNGIFLGNSEKQIENSPMGNYDEELKKAAEYLRAYNEREFAISPDNEPFTKDSLSHIGLGYTEIGDNADYSFEVEADLEKYEVRYFIDEKLVKTDKYNSLQEMNEQELSNLEFDYFVSEGNEMLDKMLEAGELILTDIKEEAPLRKISNENNSYMIVDDVRHAIDELFSGTASDGRKSGGYDWKNYHNAFKSVLDANVQSDIALPLYKSDAEKILLAAQSENTDTISDKEYENALSCLDMVLKNGHLLENPKEHEEQFSFFSTKSHYVSMDEIKPSFSKHKDPETEKDVVSKTDKSDITAVNSDYTITENNYGDFGGDKTRCQNNIAAIRLLKQIESEKRNASPDEQQILAKYIGWGGLANAFDSSKAEWHKEYSELKELLSPDEYASARASTLNAHYTSYTVINAIYSTLDNMGFKGGKILEPAMGTGNFFGSMPEEMRKNSSLSGVELDSITGRIAKLLYPSANIQIKGYERTSYENNSFDVAVSNVPFGSYKVNDKDYNKQNMLIHDYFFAKTLDKVRPGGIVAFVTSKGTLDKESPEVRKYLAERAELLGAIRLPNTAFKQNAGTEVTSDIIFLQKREKPVSVEQNTPEWVFKDILPNGIAVNKYFTDHPEMILGEMVEGNKLYGNQANATMCVPIEGANLKEQLAAAIQNIKGEYREAPKTAEKEEKSSVVSCPPEAQKFSYIVQNDTLYYHGSNDTMDIVDNPQTERIKAMAFLRDSVHNLLELQINNYNGNKEIEIANAQKALSEQYDTFVEKYGRIGLAENKKAFANDNSYHLLKSLEKMDNNGNFIGKADIFSKKTINPQVIIDHCNNAQDALILSLSEKMRVDMDYMSILTDKSESELIAELGDKIYQNPQKNMRWESADEYLTGNIRTKLAVAEEAGLERNAEALRAVMPQRIEAADISVKLGSAWIDPEYIRQFILETIKPDFQTRNSIEVIYSEATDKWKIEGYQHSYGNTLATETYGTSDMNAYEIIEASLNMKKAEIRERVKDEKGVEIRDEKGHYVLAVNQEKTMVVQAKQDELKRKFQDWIFAEPGRRETLTNLYNEKFNSVRLREYDGSHLNFVGMNSDIALKPHQKNAVARSLYSNGNTLLAHEVGAGKTFEMVAIAMEGKRLGLHSKSLVTAPNALTEQWGVPAGSAFPSAPD